MKESGLVQKNIKTYQMEAQVCKDYSGEPVSMHQCFTAFQIFAIGTSIAVLGIMFEVLFRHQLMNTIFHVTKENVEKVIRLDKRKNLVENNVGKRGFCTIRTPVKVMSNKDKKLAGQHDRMITLEKMIDELQKQNTRLKLKMLNRKFHLGRKNLKQQKFRAVLFLILETLISINISELIPLLYHPLLVP